MKIIGQEGDNIGIVLSIREAKLMMLLFGSVVNIIGTQIRQECDDVFSSLEEEGIDCTTDFEGVEEDGLTILE